MQQKFIPDKIRSRKGGVLIVMMVCLLLSSIFLTNMVRAVRLRSEQSFQREQILQTTWLIQAGFERAAQKLREDPNYTGELWTISATDWSHEYAARIKISVRIPKADSKTRIVKVESRYPSSNTETVLPGETQLTQEISLQLASAKGTE